MTDRIDALKTLHTSLIDSRNGYDEAVKQSAGEGLEPLFHSMIKLRNASAAEILRHLTLLGEPTDSDGSLMTTVHRTVIDMRAYVTGLGKSILPSLISGEERIIANYDEALAQSDPSYAEYGMLIEQRDKLIAKVDEMRSMNARAAA